MVQFKMFRRIGNTKIVKILKMKKSIKSDDPTTMNGPSLSNIKNTGNNSIRPTGNELITLNTPTTTTTTTTNSNNKPQVMTPRAIAANPLMSNVITAAAAATTMNTITANSPAIVATTNTRNNSGSGNNGNNGNDDNNGYTNTGYTNDNAGDNDDGNNSGGGNSSSSSTNISTVSSNDDNKNKDEQQYLNLLADIMINGELRMDRTKVGTRAIFGTRMSFNMRGENDMCTPYPLLTTKRMFFRTVAEELLWFIGGQTDAKLLQAQGVHIWDGNSTREFLDKNGHTDREVGDLGPIYGFQWRHFGAKYRTCRDNYRGEGIDQLRQVIHTIKTNPTDRRILMTAWNPSDIPQMALPPCHCMAQFYVSHRNGGGSGGGVGELSCQLYQRSADMGLGVPFNIASYALLTRMIAHVCGLRTGDFIHIMGDTHIYLNHLDALGEQVIREPRPFPKLIIKRKIDNIDDFRFHDFELVDYNPHPKIYMEMAV